MWWIRTSRLTIKSSLSDGPRRALRSLDAEWLLSNVPVRTLYSEGHRKVDIRLHGKGNSNLPWRKAGQPSHLVDVVDSDQFVVNEELSLSLSVKRACANIQFREPSRSMQGPSSIIPLEYEAESYSLCPYKFLHLLVDKRKQKGTCGFTNA